MPDQTYQRDKNGIRLDLQGGMNTMLPPDAMPQGYPYLQNVRRNLLGRAVSRPALGNNILALTLARSITSLVQVNDEVSSFANPPYMLDPPSALILGDVRGNLFVDNTLSGVHATTLEATGLSTNPLSFVTFRPNASPEPWCYIGDPSQSVSIFQVKNLTATPSTIGLTDTGPLATLWTNPANANSATLFTTYSGGVSNSLILVVAGPAIPITATVTGIMVRFQASVSAGTVNLNMAPNLPGAIVATLPLSTTLQNYTAGGITATWGVALTPALLNPGFTFSISSDATADTVSLNSFTITIFYTAAVPFACTGMIKVRSDGTAYKTGIAEPQVAPSVSSSGTGGPNWLIYRYTYRSTATGAVSNPSPESPPETIAQTVVTKSAVADNNVNTAFNTTQWQFTGGTPTFLETKNETPGALVDYVVAKNFSLAIPDNVTINGVTVTVNWAGQNAGTGVLTNVALYYQGAPFGTAKSPGIQNVKFTATPPYGTDVTQGDNTDTWGATLTPAVLNDPTFGFGAQITEEAAGGSSRSFIYSFTITVYYALMTAGVSATPSLDPQVDKIDFYRQSPGLSNFTYVGTVPNTTQVLNDTVTDLAAAANPLLEFDNFEPFPSIDLPRKGIVNVIANPGAPGGNMVQFVSGDPFNPRWLPGTIILIGGVSANVAATAYSLYNRPIPGSGAATLIAVNIATDPVTGYQVFAFPPLGTNLTYEIAEPTLAAQASPVIWGPTPDNYGSFYFGLDPLNPGDLLWSKGNNFDSAPDTNRMFVTSPSEVLMNGTVTAELSTVFSAERFWLINWNFADAIATVTGTEGPQWTLTQAAATRGLYMRYAIAALGSMIAYRAKDCIAISSGGSAEQSITDDIYNLFPHGGSHPQPVTIGGQTVFPPDDTKPSAQTITLTSSYVFYNYQDTTGTQRTLIYDLNAKGWSVDVYTPKVNCHLWAVTGLTSSQLLTGCADGTVRVLGDGGEVGTSIIATRSENGGDARAFKRVGDVFIKALVTSGNPVTVALWRTRFTLPITPASYAPASLTGTGALRPYIVDFVAGFASDLDDIAALLSWPLGTTNVLDLWQPDWTELPEAVQDRPSDWANGGTDQNKFVQGLLLECDTFGLAKTFQVESDNGVLHTPVEVPFKQSGEAVRSFTFSPPFTAHMVRIISTDEVPWRFGPAGGWTCSWIAQPFPESSMVWTTEASSYGLLGYIHLYQINLAYYSLAPVTCTVATDQGTFTMTFPAAGAPALPAKVLLKAPPNKWKIASFSFTSAAPIQIYKDWTEVWLGQWGRTSEYQKNTPFGADTSPAATI